MLMLYFGRKVGVDMGKNHSKSAQVTIEYLLLMAVTIGVLVVFLARGGVFDKGMRNIIDSESESVIDTGTAIFF